jgi:hypothetical protein
VPHGLAWGETGEGRNPGALALDLLYERIVAADTDWANVREDGFTWWPADYKQEITVGGGLQMVTQVRENVPVTDEALAIVARLNAGLGSSTLILTGSGELRLAASVPVGAPDDQNFPQFALGLAARQVSAAGELRSALTGLGELAVSEHPFSGPRPRPASAERLAAGVAETEPSAELAPRVALLALTGQAFLPYLISVRGDGGLDFAWRLSQFSEDVVGTPQDPLVRGSVYPVDGDDGAAGPGWTVWMRLPVAGDTAQWAIWCNKQNKALSSRAGEANTAIVPGGWGLSPDGECCLSSWLPSFPDLTEHGQVLHLRRVIADHASAVRSALTRTKPGRVISTSVTVEELAVGLTQAVTAFQSVLDYPADFRCALESGQAGVTLAVTAARGDLPALAEAKDDSARAVVLIPATANRTELAISYAVLLGHAASRIEAGGELDLVPGELPGWAFAGEQVGGAVGQLSDAGIFPWPPGEDENGILELFPAGQERGRLRFKVLPSPRLHGAEPLMISAEVDGLNLPQADGPRYDVNLLGTWRKSGKTACYEVTVPPAGLLWPLDLTVSDLLTWLIRHVVRRVQSAAIRQDTDGFRNAYPTSVEELLARVEDRLAQGMAPRDLSAPAYALADALAQAGSPKPLVEAMRQLGGALRYSPNPRYELTAARKALANALVPPPPGRRARRREQ